MPDPDPPIVDRGLAEGMGFEPMVGYKPTLDFESSALNQLSHPSTSRIPKEHGLLERHAC